ncbi:hypothetical protein OKW30_005995 [Paraburkholderia sp. Clong3]
MIRMDRKREAKPAGHMHGVVEVSISPNVDLA